MKLLNIYYDKTTGEIKGYQGGNLVTPDNEIPEGCARIVYPGDVNIWHEKTYRTIYKINIENGDLVLDRKKLEEQNV